MPWGLDVRSMLAGYVLGNTLLLLAFCGLYQLHRVAVWWADRQRARAALQSLLSPRRRPAERRTW